MSDNIKKFLDLTGLTAYDGKIKKVISDETLAGKNADTALKTFLGNPDGYPDNNIPLYADTVNAAADAKAAAITAQNSATNSAAAAETSAQTAANILGTSADDATKNTVYGVYAKAAHKVDTGLLEISDAVKDGILTLQDKEGEITGNIDTYVTTVVTPAIDGAKTAAVKDVNDAKTAATGAIATDLAAAEAAIATAGGDAIDAVNSALDDAKSAISGDLAAAKSDITAATDDAKNTAVNEVNTAKTTATNAISADLAAAEAAISTDLAAAKSAISTDLTAATGAIDTAKESALAVISEATDTAQVTIDNYVETTSKPAIDAYVNGTSIPAIDTAKTAAVKAVNEALAPVTDAQTAAEVAQAAAEVAQAAAEVAANTATNAVTGFSAELGKRPDPNSTVWGSIGELKSATAGGVHFRGVYSALPEISVITGPTGNKYVAEVDLDEIEFKIGDIIIVEGSATGDNSQIGEPTKEYILAFVEGTDEVKWVELGDVSPADQKITSLQNTKLDKAALTPTEDTIDDLESNSVYTLVELTADEHAFVRIGAIDTGDIDKLFA